MGLTKRQAPKVISENGECGLLNVGRFLVAQRGTIDFLDNNLPATGGANKLLGGLTDLSNINFHSIISPL